MNRIKLCVDVDEEDRQDIFYFEYDADTKMIDIFKGLNYLGVYLQIYKYVTINNYIYQYENKLPYILGESEIHWFPDIDKIRVIDFIRTYNLEEIHLTGINNPCGGDGGITLISIFEMWKLVYPILTGTSVIVTLVTGGISFGKWLKTLTKRRVPPICYFDLVLARQYWNSFELAEFLSIDIDEAKDLLRGLGYKWDNQVKMFVKSERVLNITNELANVDWYKCIEPKKIRAK